MKNSPFHSLHENLGASFSEYHGWNLPSYYESAEAEISGMNTSSAAFDLSSFGRIMLKGDSAGEVVSRLTGDIIASVEPDSWGWAVHKSDGLLRVCRLGDNYLLLTVPGKNEALVNKIEQINSESDFGKVAIADQTEKTGMIGVYGPNAMVAIDNILPIEIGDLEPGQTKSFSFFMMQITVIRGSWIGSDGIEMICPAMASKMAGSAIEKYHKQEGIIPAGMQCLSQAMKDLKLPSGIAFDDGLDLFN